MGQGLESIQDAVYWPSVRLILQLYSCGFTIAVFGLRKFVQGVALIASVLALAVLALPAVGGYVYAVLLFPAYDQSEPCKSRKADPVSEDDFRVYLLNHGCTVREALGGLAREFRIDPGRLLALHSGAQQPRSADEVSAWDAVQASLRQFKPFASAAACPPYCLSDFWGDDVVSQLFQRAFDSYFIVATPIFYEALAVGAAHIAGAAQQGPLAQGFLYFGYLIGFGVLASAIWAALKRAFT